METLARVCELATPGGFQKVEARTVSVNTAQISVVSRYLSKGGKWRGHRLSTREMIEGLAFMVVEETAKMFVPNLGEEILMTLAKR